MRIAILGVVVVLLVTAGMWMALDPQRSARLFTRRPTALPFPVSEVAATDIQKIVWQHYGPPGPTARLELWPDGRSRAEVIWDNKDPRLALAVPRAGWEQKNGSFTREQVIPPALVRERFRQLLDQQVHQLQSDQSARAELGGYCLGLVCADRRVVRFLSRRHAPPDPQDAARYAAAVELLTFDADAWCIDPARAKLQCLEALTEASDPSLRASALRLLRRGPALWPVTSPEAHDQAASASD